MSEPTSLNAGVLAELARAANTFTIRVVCSNCVNEYDMQFEIGTRFDQHGYGCESSLVVVTSKADYLVTPVKCIRCGAARLSRKLRQA